MNFPLGMSIFYGCCSQGYFSAGLQQARLLGRRLRAAGKGVWSLSALRPAEPDTHLVPTFCFILLTALCLPVLEKARED